MLAHDWLGSGLTFQVMICKVIANVDDCFFCFLKWCLRRWEVFSEWGQSRFIYLCPGVLCYAAKLYLLIYAFLSTWFVSHFISVDVNIFYNWMIINFVVLTWTRYWTKIDISVISDMWQHCNDMYSSSSEHYNDVIMSAIIYSTVYSGADQRKHLSSASLAFVRGIHQ